MKACLESVFAADGHLLTGGCFATLHPLLFLREGELDATLRRLR